MNNALENYSLIKVSAGNVFVRSVADGSAIIGVIAVPAIMPGEMVYPAKLGDTHGMSLFNTPRLPIGTDGPIHNLAELDANFLLMQRMYRAYQEDGVLDVFLRDTLIPDAPSGHKWMLVVGASRSKGDSKTINIVDGKVSSVIGDYVGEAFNSIVNFPKWGNPNNPHALSTTIHFNSIQKVVQESRSRNHDEIFLEYARQLEEVSPMKTCYSKQELAERDVLAKAILKKLVDSKFESEYGAASGHKM